MKTLRIALLAAAVAVGVPGLALAQDRDQGDRGGDRGGRPEGARPEGGRPEGARPEGGRPDNRGGGDRRGQAQPQPQPQPQQAPQAQAERRDYRGGGQQGRPDQADDRRFQGRDDRRFDRGPDDRGSGFAGRPDDRRPDNRGPGGRGPGYGGRDDRGPGFAGRDGRPGPDRAWRPGYNWRADRGYDWRGYRSYNRSAFSIGRYYAPRGWGYGYRRFSVGYRLPSFFYAQNYWLEDPYAYRLPPAYGPYRWIRYYDDVLLVDLRTGAIVDEIPDFFL